MLGKLGFLSEMHEELKLSVLYGGYATKYSNGEYGSHMLFNNMKRCCNYRIRKLSKKEYKAVYSQIRKDECIDNIQNDGIDKPYGDLAYAIRQAGAHLDVLAHKKYLKERYFDGMVLHDPKFTFLRYYVMK